MGFLDILGKGVDLLTDFIPGGNLVQDLAENVIPGAEEFFEGTLDDMLSESTSPDPTTTEMLPTQYTGIPSGPAMPESLSNDFPLLQFAQGVAADIFNSGGGVPAVTNSSMPMPTYQGAQAAPAVSGNLPCTVASLRPVELPQTAMRVYYRAPKGYVIIPVQGVKRCLRKDVARQFGWKPNKKPPISATQWGHYKSAEKVKKILRKVASKEITEARRSAKASAKKRKR